jgi:2-C-methyl-D-erythritol 4-phosphate cytidylyltransferase
MDELRDVGLIIAAAGSGQRMGTPIRKPFLTIGKEPMLHLTCRRFSLLQEIVQRIILVHPDDLEGWQAQWRDKLREFGVADVHDIVPGGPTRCDSVVNGLRHLHPDVRYVAIHDAARPFVKLSAVRECIQRARQTGAAIVAAPLADTLKQVDGRLIRSTLDRSQYWLAQTPQVFERSLIERAYFELCPTVESVTDDAQLVEMLGHPVEVVQGSPLNIKITTPDDLAIAWGIIQCAGLDD